MPQTVGTPRVAGFARVGRRVGQGFSEVPIFPQIAKKRHDFMQNRVSFGAATQIRTGDLILTKDALYLLSYSSKVHAPLKGACVATEKGLEPSTSGVTGRRSNQLNYPATASL